MRLCLCLPNKRDNNSSCSRFCVWVELLLSLARSGFHSVRTRQMKSSETEKVSTQGFEKSQVTISQHVFCNKSDDTLCFTVFLYGCLKTQCRCMYNKKEFFCTNLADIFNKLLLLIWWFVFSLVGGIARGRLWWSVSGTTRIMVGDIGDISLTCLKWQMLSVP